MRTLYLIFFLIFLVSSCKTIDRKIDNLSMEEEKNLSKFLGRSQTELIDEFGLNQVDIEPYMPMKKEKLSEKRCV